MRYIQKTTCPTCLSDWIEAQRPVGNNLTYGNFRDKTQLLDALIAEQKGLCAYTGKYVTRQNGHNEHVKPQSVCRDELERAGGTFGRDLCCDLEYTNLVAAIKTTGEISYGAVARENQFPAWFISPLTPGCETRFLYTELGEVIPANPGDADARRMIELLKLEKLNDERRGKIEALFPVDADPPQTNDELKAIAEACDRETDGFLPEYCFVIKSVALSKLP